MVDFRKLISPRSRAKHAAVTDALEEFSSLDAPEMARSLLDMSRRAFELAGYKEDRFYSYDEAALVRIIPEIALRLDPTVELTELETAKPEEAEDKITWVKGMSDERLKEMVDSCVSHASFAKILHGSEDERAGYDEERERLHDLFAGRRETGIMVRAMEKLRPGSYDLERKGSAREDLTGVQVIVEREHHDKVLGYFEDNTSAMDFYSEAKENVEKDPEEWSEAFREKLRWVGDLNANAISIQDFHGAVLERHDFTSEDCSPEP